MIWLTKYLMAVKMIVFQNQFVPYTTLIIIIALRYFSRTYILYTYWNWNFFFSILKRCIHKISVTGTPYFSWHFLRALVYPRQWTSVRLYCRDPRHFSLFITPGLTWEKVLHSVSLMIDVFFNFGIFYTILVRFRLAKENILIDAKNMLFSNLLLKQQKLKKVLSKSWQEWLSGSTRLTIASS